MTTVLLAAVIVSTVYVYGLLLTIIANIVPRRPSRHPSWESRQELTRIREFQYN
ncbi:MAG: hypothetical protein N2561_07400 [Bacteroidetes bacterium]|nr:hypothetical protein [Rhodothermia bacterium]MCS7155059.1 hypothetical protein [Bacteroidota bacterium]MCX7907343.1 hypothetical protein [Bacteroidota bacterium]MDW8137930.1 hypothetical protein [Bacteroidota bacterium]MDW8286218.1 hypothetical protein [Bacteroidota bacterium]